MNDPGPKPVLLAVVPERDPLERRGLRGRDAVYRLRLALKHMLRSQGWRCVSASNLPPPVVYPGGEYI